MGDGLTLCHWFIANFPAYSHCRVREYLFHVSWSTFNFNRSHLEMVSPYDTGLSYVAGLLLTPLLICIVGLECIRFM